MFHLIAHNGRHRGRRLSLRAADITVGSGPDCPLRLVGEGVVARHARLQERDGDVFVTALDPAAEVRINGRAESERRLQAGDRIGIGEFELEFQPTLAMTEPQALSLSKRYNPWLAYALVAAFLLVQAAIMIFVNTLYLHAKGPPAAAPPEEASDGSAPASAGDATP
jgi:hypothetical protein